MLCSFMEDNIHPLLQGGYYLLIKLIDGERTCSAERIRSSALSLPLRSGLLGRQAHTLRNRLYGQIYTNRKVKISMNYEAKR